MIENTPSKKIFMVENKKILKRLNYEYIAIVIYWKWFTQVKVKVKI